ncbi:2-keto-3-deoxygluconate transporter [Catenovulum maritimum]|uniref:2-keto-3-deoxygluconate permease n=1 Tax=Catenovulum maritimum TaxID=1513271 RepID=A0A0J8GT53_9ALTE|nr:2-keto-3-deoxygluconate transporter [Catenovulum maritimum]KMT63883.1 2-keto-3-deoxygluconate permease [Catenovulum maritimum]
MKIKQAVERVPGGMMLVPLFLGALINTLAPDSADYFGGFTKGIMTGVLPILAVWFFCIGASINLKSTGIVIRKSGTLVVTKIGTAWLVAIIAAALLPENGIEAGIFAGLSTLAIVSAMDMTNGGLYASLMNQYGSKEESGAFILMSLESGPLMTMLILGSVGAATFEPHHFIGAVLPFLAGFILGNLDVSLREFFSRASAVMIPFVGFALGNTINLGVIFETGLLGILLGLAVIIITGIPLIFADRWIGKGNGTAGVAASSTAGAAIANPAAIAAIEPKFAVAAQSATALIATSVIVTSILVPIITAMYHKRYGDPTQVENESLIDKNELEMSH